MTKTLLPKLLKRCDTTSRDEYNERRDLQAVCHKHSSYGLFTLPTRVLPVSVVWTSY